MKSTRVSAIAAALSARGKKGRPVPNRQTRPNEPASSRLQPRARLKNAPAGAVGCTRIHAATATQTTASSSRPPAHHPTRQHAASAGATRRSVSSTGSSARSGVYAGMMRNARSARRSFPHPRSDGAGVTGSDISARETSRVRQEREIARALDRGAQLTLVPRAHAAQAAGQDLSVVGDEAAEGALVLVVDETDAALAEWAGLGWASHGLLLVL